MRVPASSALAALLLVLAAVLQMGLHDRSVVPMDEGHLAAVAEWLLEGKHLYRDIHTGIFPGIYYVSVLLFTLFESNLLVLRAAQLGVNLILVVLLWRISLRVAAPLWALLAPLLFMALIALAFPVLTMFNYSTLSVCFGLGALLFLLRYLERGRMRDALALGFLLACCGLTKQNFGALALVALAVGLLWGRRDSPLAGRPFARVLLPVLVATGVPPLVALLFFVSTGTLGAFLDATLLGLGGSQLASFNNPIPPLFGALPLEDGRFIFLYTPPLLFNALLRGESILGVQLSPLLLALSIRLSYLIPLLLLLGGAALLVAGRARRPVVIYALVFFPGIFPSAIWSHLAFALIPTLLLVPALGQQVEQALDRSRVAVALWRACALALAAGAVGICFQAHASVRRWYPVALGLPRATLHVSPDQAQLLRGAMLFLSTCSKAGEAIFAAPDIPLVYFLGDRPNPTPFDLTIPGNVDGKRIVETLERERTRCVVYNPRMYPEFPPFTELFGELSAYLTTKYHTAEVIQGESTTWHGLVRR